MFSLQISITVVLVMLASLVGAEPEQPQVDANGRPLKWAQPVAGIEGVENLYKLTDNLYRSGQPTVKGFTNLEKMGIKTVICLRSILNDTKEGKHTSLNVKYVPISFYKVTDKDLIKVLKILEKKEDGPFLIHCLHGSDRTGVACAAYRIFCEGWSKEDALNEMAQGGYGYHAILSHIPRLIQDLDIETIKKEVRKTP